MRKSKVTTSAGVNPIGVGTAGEVLVTTSTSPVPSPTTVGPPSVVGAEGAASERVAPSALPPDPATAEHPPSRSSGRRVRRRQARKRQDVVLYDEDEVIARSLDDDPEMLEARRKLIAEAFAEPPDSGHSIGWWADTDTSLVRHDDGRIVST